VSFDENDIRRALDARSAGPAPEFRDRLSAALARGRRAPDRMPALAAAAAIVLAIAVVGTLVFVRLGSAPRVTPGGHSPVASAQRSPISTPTPTSEAGVVVPPKGSIPLPAEATLSAPSHDVVWALMTAQGEFLYRSTDQGHTWKQEPLPPSMVGVVQISFVSDTEGWLMALSSPETQCNAQGLQLWHTADEGNTWQLLGAQGIADRQCKTGLSFTDSRHGFISTWDQNGRPVIYFTVDGGLSWTASAPLSDPPGFTSQPGGTYFATANVRSFGRFFLVPVYGYQGGQMLQYIYLSNDGGRSWGYNANAGTSGGTVALVTMTHWYVLIGPGQSMETVDGGVTWHVSSSDYSQAAPIRPGVDFADSEVGYATVRGEIQLTIDGGQHWTSIKSPGT
jgi:photosystem II stability/assembly factor-like uncharacterized protein